MTIAAQVSDHHLIYADISLVKPTMAPQIVTFRKTKDIVMEDFKTDIKSSNIYQNHKSMTLEELVHGYNTELRRILDTHAPIIRRKRSIPRREKWYTSELHNLRRQSRVVERRYRKYQARDDLKAFERMQKEYLARRFEAQKSFYTEHFEHIDRDQKAVFKAATKIMHRTDPNPLPDHDSAKKLA